jgi:prolipoprotein diacylglyceryltransferase
MYGLMLLAGIAACIALTGYRWTRRGGDWDLIFRVAVWGVGAGIVGARLYHLATSWSEVPDEWWGPFAVWEGGLGIWGGIAGGVLVGGIVAKRAGASVTALLDAAAPGLLVAQAIGRVGNWWNQELFGGPTDLPWGLEIDRPNPAIPVGIPEDALFHPTFLYEIIWLVSGFIILMLIENRVSLTAIQTASGGKLPKLEFVRRDAWHWGKMFGLYAIWYGLGRAWFESIRLDPSETLFGIRSNVWGALAYILAGIIVIIVQTRRHPGVEASVYRPGKEWTPESAVDSEAIYSDDETGDGAESTTPAPATSGASRT